MKRLVIFALVACGHAHEHQEATEPPAVSFTQWTQKHEFFVEHPPFFAGQPTALAVHVTVLDGHDAATGTVTVNGVAAQASRPGIFRPTITLPAGPCTLAIEVAGDRITQPCVVHAAGAKLPPDEPEPPGRITFLKETAWQIDFATAAAGERELVPTLRTTGEIRATAGREAKLGAAARGRIILEGTPVLGARVAANEVLARIVPQAENAGDRVSLAADTRQAQAELAAADTDLGRANRLWEAKAIPEKQLEAARTRVEVARARLEAARGKQTQLDVATSGRGAGASTYQVRSPIAGTLVAIHVAAGQAVDTGAELFTVVDLDRIWVHADVFEPDVAAVERSTRAAFRVDGYDQTIPIAPPDGRVVTIGKLVDEKTRTVPIIFELANPEQRLRIGSLATVWIETGEALRALAVPETAVVDDAGRKVVYVQVGGEAFERRLVQIGIRTGGWMQITSGLNVGERVVTRGAYDIKLAAAAGAVPEHGHAH